VRDSGKWGSGCRLDREIIHRRNSRTNVGKKTYEVLKGQVVRPFPVGQDETGAIADGVRVAKLREP
jgi:hypothetical protein